MTPYADLKVCSTTPCTHYQHQSPGGYQRRKYEHMCRIHFNSHTIAIEYMNGVIKSSILFVPEDCPYTLEHTLLDAELNHDSQQPTIHNREI